MEKTSDRKEIGCPHCAAISKKQKEEDEAKDNRILNVLKEQKADIIKIVISLSLLTSAVIVQNNYASIALYLISYAVVGYEVILKATENILRGKIFDENLLMSIATLGAVALGKFPEAVAVMVFYKIGELFEDAAADKSKESISKLMDINPNKANVERDGEILTLDSSDVNVGEIIVVKAGEKIPLDGVVVFGESRLNTSALTGESVPRFVGAGDKVMSGCVNLSGFLKIKVEKDFENSSVAKISELVEDALSKKSNSERFITKFARYYTPAVVIAAFAIAVVPPLFLGNWASWIERGLIFLTVSCPCALVISVPLTFFGGIGVGARHGILIKSGNCLEKLAKTKTVIFDKTGTVTTGSFEVVKYNEEALKTAARAEAVSNHPIAESIKEAYEKIQKRAEEKESQISEVALMTSPPREIAGLGISATLDGKNILVGSKKLMNSYNIFCEEISNDSGNGTSVHVAKDGVYLGRILIADKIKDDAKPAVDELRKIGVENIVMLTGDCENSAKAVAEALGISSYRAELLPGDKVAALEEFSRDENSSPVVFVGDGINDVPVLARSDVGFAPGALGSDAAREAADVVLTDDSLLKIPKAVSISKKTMKIVISNIVLALGVKGAVLICASLGFANLWLAVFADVGVSVIAILNACRMLRF